LEIYCKRFGYPQLLHSDRGPHFHNQECLDWAEKVGIKWVFGSPGQAKGQGKVERAIRTVKTSIRRMADEDPKAWAKLVADAQFAFNTRHPFSTTGTSPAELLLGYLPRQRVLNLVEPRVADRLVSMTESAIDELRELRLAKLDSLRQEAVTRQLDYWAKRVTAHDDGLRKHRCGIGDLVLYQNYPLKAQHGNPWKFRWRGPVEIVHITAKGKLHLRHEETGDVMKGWHSDKVRPYVLRHEASVAPSIDDSENL